MVRQPLNEVVVIDTMIPLGGQYLDVCAREVESMVASDGSDDTIAPVFEQLPEVAR